MQAAKTTQLQISAHLHYLIYILLIYCFGNKLKSKHLDEDASVHGLDELTTSLHTHRPTHTHHSCGLRALGNPSEAT